eukprot:TRINITY_DN2703_c0_g1_i1.p1 TRINITY_DN2703_c0_g1~~TRINITY_DN2703_c0_g1_i1.p1  ORF type:complete len:418 (-),score=53.15 TRINITY_DN2703_c0_g1_i1:182-1435(-)
MEEILKWRRRKKHIFIFSNAGKPIYSKHLCDESKLAGVTGVLVAMIEFVSDRDDTIVSVNAGSHKIVFLLKPPIYCVMVADTTESNDQMIHQLEYIHSQIISFLTISAHRILDDKPGFDLRNLLNGTDRCFNKLARSLDTGLPYILNALPCLRIPSNIRVFIGNCIQESREGEIFYVLLLARGKLVHIVRPKKHVLSPPDLHLIINFVTSSAQEFKQNELILAPLCLPSFNNTGFLHLFITYFTDSVSLVLISPKAEDFPLVYQTQQKIYSTLKFHPNDILSRIHEASVPCGSGSVKIHELGIPKLWHFIYKWTDRSQIIVPAFSVPYATLKDQKRLVRLYQEVIHSMHLLKHNSHRFHYQRTESEILLGWITSGFEFYLCFNPTTTKTVAITSCNQLLKWIKQEEQSVFLVSSPVW